MERTGKTLTTQEILKGYKGRQEQLSQLLKGCSLTGSQERYVALFRESVELGVKIRNIEELIVPLGPSGMVSSYSVGASRGLENRRTTTKKP